MVPDAADVLTGPATLDWVRVAFDEQRLVSDAGLLVIATLAERLGLEKVGERVGVAGVSGRGRGAAGPQR